MTPKGKTPSLIGGSLGRPEMVVAKKRCTCSRCDEDILKDVACFSVPQPTKTFNSPRRFCARCFASVLVKTRDDLTELENLVAAGTGHEAARSK